MSMELPNKTAYSKYRLAKAKETILELKVLIDNHFWNTAINRMYYACYYAVCALLVLDDINASTHAGVKFKFGQLYVKTGVVEKDMGKLFSDLFEKRQKGDYNDFFDYDEDIVLIFYPRVLIFLEKLEEIISSKQQ